MTVPQSLLLVALGVLWLIVLVPSSSRRRGHVHQIVEGSGFRVLRRQPAPGRRLMNRTAAMNLASAGKTQSEDQMASQQPDVEHAHADDDTVVLDAVDAEGRTPDDDPAQLTLLDKPTRSGSSPFPPAGVRDDTDHAPVDGDYGDLDAQYGDVDAQYDDLDGQHVGVDQPQDHTDEAELRRQYQAWRESTRPAEEPAEKVAPEVEPDNVRPIPRSPGRGTYDPDAAERARAYKFARRRRTLMILALLLAAFTVSAVLVSPTLWIGVGLAAVLLVLFLAHLRRQVKIEADIRERRLAKLQRARQIRPERPQTADRQGDPYAQRAPRPHQASGPVTHRSNRVVLELDDDDPGFDDLEQYEPMEYRRAVGQ